MFGKYGPEDTIEDLFKSSKILYIDCYPMCVNQEALGQWSREWIFCGPDGGDSVHNGFYLWRK